MRCLHRAWLSAKGKWKRNIILLCVFSVIFFTLFVLLFSWSSTKNQIQFIQSSLGNMISVHKEDVVYTGSNTMFSENDLRTMRECEGVLQVNTLTMGEMELQNAEAYVLDEEASKEREERMVRLMEASGFPDYKAADSRAIAVTDSRQSFFFTGGGFYLEEGEAITETDRGQNVVLISHELAEKNGLKPGDILEVKIDASQRRMGFDSTSLMLKVKGIFHWEYIGENVDNKAASPANFLFMPENILRDTYKIQPSIVYVFAADGFQIEDTIQNLREGLGETSIDMEQREGRFIYDWDSRWSSDVGEPLLQAKALIGSVFSIFMSGAMCITGIIVAFVIREKHYEIFVYMNLGEKEARIVVQILAEFFGMILISALIACMSAAAVSPRINQYILEPYTEITNNKLRTAKDEQLLKDRANSVILEQELSKSNTLFFKAVTNTVPFSVRREDVLIMAVVLFLMLPAMIAGLAWRELKRTGWRSYI
ncbi:MAG: ABC transporter permease [Eubacteriales bacterium]|nr:ABC transporter permease [Eubacteriales bacterium]